MAVLLLVIIYMAFISLGLPDSLLGVTLPSFQDEWGITLGAGGAISMVVIGGTIMASFLSSPIIKRLGTGKITFLSCVITGSALLGISLAPSYPWVLLMALPLGLGGGTVDTALNHYVALNFKAHHMNWLHSFWGVGATLGPLVMSWALVHRDSWRIGYQTISIVQLSLAIFLFMTLFLWQKNNLGKTGTLKQEDPEEVGQTEKRVFHIKGTKLAFLTMLFYCATETGLGLLGGSFLVLSREISQGAAAMWMSLYFGGITVGRFFSGVISMKLSNDQMIRFGVLMALGGVILLLLPLPSFTIGPAFVLIGLGLSPVFPAMLHETPKRFGIESSQKIIGYQMGFGYIGSALIPPSIAAILQRTGTAPLPYIMLLFLLAILFFASKLRQNFSIQEKED
ncbi:MAG: MFS transporter [Spirochaetales bacterium]|nr:MFS transporter [Spirochaetales bacterium]